jgi:uncharacterized RDD family membrane protein YckC
MLAVKLDTGFNIEVEFPITAFHRRLLAWLIDFFVLIGYLWLMGRLLSAIFQGSWGGEWIVVLYLLPYFFYHLVMEFTLNGQSIGKKAMSIRVITLEGGQPSFSQYLIRWMFRLIDIGWLVPGFLCIILTNKSQRIGDMVAGTIMIDTRAHTSWEDTIFTEVETTYQPRYMQVMDLSDKDINTLKSIIETVKKNNDHDLAFRISARIREKLKIQSDQDPYDFLQTLLKDYNYYAINN